MLTMRQKKAVTRELRDRYQRASKKEKTMRLNEFIPLTRYNRCYAGQVLREKKIYDQDLLVALKEIGKISDYMRLAAFLIRDYPGIRKMGRD